MINPRRGRPGSLRKARVIAALLGAWVLIAGSAPASTADSISRSVKINRCSEAPESLSAALKGRAGAGDMLSSDPPDFVDPLKPGTNEPIIGPNSRQWRTGWIGKAPAPALVQRWYGAPHTSIAQCFGPGPSNRPLRQVLGLPVRKPIERIEPPLVRVSLPVFDESRTHAILLDSWMGRFGGSLELVSLTRTGSSWKRTGQLTLIQS